MAAVASTRPTRGPAHQLTPPSSSHGKQGLWDFAVPVNDSYSSHEPESYMTEYVTTKHSPRQPLTSQANGFAQPVHSSNWDSQDQYYENNQHYPVSDRVNELHRKASGDMSASNIEQDGVSEYYKRNTANRKVPITTKAKPKKKPTKPGPTDPNWVAVEHDENNWIHRDKLKEIETRELEEAGFRVGRGSRSNSRSQSATGKSRDRNNSETNEQNAEDRHEPRKVVSPIPAEDEEPLEEYETWGSSAPEEVTPEIQQTARMNHTVRPSTSRIPLPKTSGIPVPSSGADRDAPQSRSRAGSTSWAAEGGAANGVRGRSESEGSQVMYDDKGNSRETTPPQGMTRKMSSSGSGSSPKSAQPSPKKAKTPNKPTPSSGARKPSAQKAQAKPRSISAASPPKRPGTSGGSTSRPTTSSRPEGEAPWIATMYKPDPRLPPDQQIIPTHAKRMQQAQWENEGRVGSMYDKDFRLINDDMSDQPLSQNQGFDAEKKQKNEPWPLPSPVKQPSSPEKGDRNATRSPNFELGGYKLTPTISHPRAPSPKLAPPIAPAQPRPSPTRVPELKEEGEEKKGCCCIVM